MKEIDVETLFFKILGAGFAICFTTLMVCWSWRLIVWSFEL